MTRFRRWGFISLVATGLLASAGFSPDVYAAGEGKQPKAAAKPLPPLPAPKTPIRLTPEGLHMGMSVEEVVDFYSKVLDQDYIPIYKATPIGPKMKELDATLAEQKGAFPRSEVAFGDLPTGIDNTPLKGEYSYKNNEAMLSLTRLGVRRHFFFFNRRLYKVYDVLPLKKDGELGGTYQDAVATLTKRFGIAGRVLPESSAQGRNATEVDWGDPTMHLRAIDRSFENVVGLVFEERYTAERLVAFRTSHKGDDDAVDPSISAVTRGGAAVDPNASAADSYTGKAHASQPSGAPKPAGPPKKK